MFDGWDLRGESLARKGVKGLGWCRAARAGVSSDIVITVLQDNGITMRIYDEGG